MKHMAVLKWHSHRNRIERWYHLMMAPGMAFLLVFSYIPMVGIIMAFQDFVPARGLWRSEFAGLKYFEYMFSLPDIGRIIRNTITIALGKIIFGTLAAIAFSILLNEVRNRFFRRSVQTIVYLPHFLSWIVLASAVINMFNLDGIVNQILSAAGIARVNFLGSNATFQPLIVGTDVWKEYGYNSVIYLAAITVIDPGLYEAAAIDGASWWMRVRHVTLQGMQPIILLMITVSLTGILSAGFDQIYNLYTPIVYETGDVLDTYIYRVCLEGRQFSLGAAVGLWRSAVGMGLLLSANELSKKLIDRKVF